MVRFLLVLSVAVGGSSLGHTMPATGRKKPASKTARKKKNAKPVTHPRLTAPKWFSKLKFANKKSKSKDKEKPVTYLRSFIEAPGLVISAIKHYPRMVLRGVLHGPRVAMEEIRQEPLMFVAGLATVAGIGGIGHALQLHVEPYMIGASALIIGLKYRASIRTLRLRHLSGPKAAEFIGEQIAFPTLLVGASAAGGVALAEHSAASAVAAGTVGQTSAASVAESAAASAVIGGDAPTVLTGVLGDKDK